MNNEITLAGEHRPEFSSAWTSWFGLVLGNWLLTLITFGIFRFWARTRERRHLWAHTFFGGEPLEYTGLGRELLVGAILAFFVLIVPLVMASLIGAVAQGMGLQALMIGVNLAIYAVILWVVQFAIWRAMRYRLSRTRWSGIRGAMDGSAAAYALTGMKMLGLQIITLGFASPYASARLFNARWSDARFGSMKFVAEAQWRPLQRVFLQSWGIALVGLIGVGIVEWQLIGPYFSFTPGAKPPPPPEIVFKVFGLNLVWLTVVGLIMLRYYAAQWQVLIAGLSLDGLRFRFTATAGDWLRYWLGNVALVVFTLGLGATMLLWRHWRFLVSHVAAEGALDVDRLAQTRIDAPLYGEGLADALDVGAI
ncbi:YjgN family protein [Sandarakinorhabdus oryzae]|uniref:YjgN family protein n=1 Tax=Sandarakinorhabdus oryzae TaxID=2675220 RepID=UPI0018CC50AA|nr:YjgN family protein [Sandarakinorhabdus oryzae]